MSREKRLTNQSRRDVIIHAGMGMLAAAGGALALNSAHAESSENNHPTDSPQLLEKCSDSKRRPTPTQLLKLGEHLAQLDPLPWGSSHRWAEHYLLKFLKIADRCHLPATHEATRSFRRKRTFMYGVGQYSMSEATRQNHAAKMVLVRQALEADLKALENLNEGDSLQYRQ